MTSWIDQVIQNTGNPGNFTYCEAKYVILEFADKELPSTIYNDYDWVVSLWSSGEDRLSNDLKLSTLSKKSVLFYEVDQDLKDIFIFLNLVHRSNGIPVGQGAHGAIFSNFHDATKSSATHKIFKEPLNQQTISMTVHTNNNILNIGSSFNGITKIDIDIKVGLHLSLTKLFDGDAVDILKPLVALDEPARWTELTPYQHSSYERLVFGNFLAHLSNSSDPVSYKSQEVSAIHTQSRSYVTVEDLQLAPDILDLYAKWNVLVSVGYTNSFGRCFDAAHCGHISNYQGNWAMKASLPPKTVEDLQRRGGEDRDLLVEVFISEQRPEGTIFKTVLCSGMISAEPPTAPSRGKVQQVNEIPSGTYEVLLYTQLSKDMFDDNASISSTATRLFVGRAIIQLITTPPIVAKHLPLCVQLSQSAAHEGRLPVDAAIDKFIGDGTLNLSEELSVTELQYRLFYICDQLSLLEERFIELRSEDHHQPQDVIDNYNILKSRLFSCISVILFELCQHFNSVALRGEICIRLLNESINGLTMLTSLKSYFEDWLTSALFNELMTAASEMPSVTINVTKASNQSTAQYCLSVLEQLRTILAFNSPHTSPKVPLKSLLSAVYYLQLLGNLWRASTSEWLPEELALQITLSIDYEWICELSHDLLETILVYSSSTMVTLTTALKSLEYNVEKKSSKATLQIYNSIKEEVLDFVSDSLHGVLMLFDNVSQINPNLTLIVSSYIKGVTDMLFGLIYCETSLCVETGTVTDYFKRFALIWKSLLTLLTYVMDRTELRMNQPLEYYQYVIPSAVDGLCAHIIQSVKSLPVLMHTGSHGHVVLTIITFMSILTDKMCSNCEEHESNEPIEENEQAIPTFDEDFNITALRQSTTQSNHPAFGSNYQVPDHSRRKNYKLGTSVTFNANDLPAASGESEDLSVRQAPNSPSTSTVNHFRSAVKSVQNVLKFQPAAHPTEPVVYQGPFGGELLLHFIHDNYAYFACIHSLFEVLHICQPSTFAKDKFDSIGVEYCIKLCQDVVDCIMNGLFKGREHNIAFVTRVCEALASLHGPSSVGLLHLIDFVAKVDGYHLSDCIHRIEVHKKQKVSYVYVQKHLPWRQMSMDNIRAIWTWLRRKVVSACDYLIVLYTKVQLDEGLSSRALDFHCKSPQKYSSILLAHNVSITVANYQIVVMWFQVQQQLTALLRTMIRYYLLLIQATHDTKPSTHSSSTTSTSRKGSTMSHAIHNEDTEIIMDGLFTALGQCISVLCSTTCLKQLNGIRDDVIYHLFDQTNMSEAIVQLYDLAADLPVNAVDPTELAKLCRLQGDLLRVVIRLVLNAPSQKIQKVLCSVFFQQIENSIQSALGNCEESLTFETITSASVDHYLTSTNPSVASTGKVKRYVSMNEGRRGSMTLTAMHAGSKESQVLSQVSQLLFNEALTNPTAYAMKSSYSLHIQSLKLLLSSKTLLQESTTTSTASKAASIVSESQNSLNRLFLCASLAENTFYSTNFNLITDVTNKAEVKKEIEKIDKILQWIDEIIELSGSDLEGETINSDLKSNRDLLAYVGFGHQSWLSLLKNLIHKERHLLSKSDEVHYRECEINELRDTLKYCLTAGQWEHGISLALAFQEKYKSIKSSTLTASNLDMNTSSNSIVAYSPKRSETLHSELNRAIDKLRDKIKFNDKLRLFPIFYAIRFFSDEPWEVTSMKDSTDLQRMLEEIKVEGFNLTTSQWLNTALNNKSAPKTRESNQDATNKHYEYWLVLRFDMTSNIAVVRYYQEYLVACNADVSAAEKESLKNVSLQSPISYQALSSQITSAFSEFTMISSQHMIESYITKKYSSVSHSKYHHKGLSVPAHRCKYMQLFPAFPYSICSEVNNIKPAEPTPSPSEKTVESKGKSSNEEEGESDADSEHSKEEPELSADELFASLVVSNVTKSKQGRVIDDCDDKHLVGSSLVTHFNVYSIISEEEGEHHKKSVDGKQIALQYINKYELAMSSDSISLNNLKNSKSLHDVEEFVDVKVEENQSEDEHKVNINTLHSLAVSPCNLVLLKSNTPITISKASLEIIFHTKVVVMRSYKAIVQLNKFTQVELNNEPTEDVANSFSVFVGIVTLLNNILSAPNGSCIGLHNLESIIVSERERIEIDWQQMRKEAKKVHMRELQEYEDSTKSKSLKSDSLSSKNKPKKPVEPALDVLRKEFNQKSGYQDVELLDVLRIEVMGLITDTLKELRKFVEKNNVVTTKLSLEEIRSHAIKRGRRPTLADQLQLSRTLNKLETKAEATDGEEDDFLDDEKSLKSKLCLYLESLQAAIEIGLMI